MGLAVQAGRVVSMHAQRIPYAAEEAHESNRSPGESSLLIETRQCLAGESILEHRAIGEEHVATRFSAFRSRIQTWPPDLRYTTW